MEESNRRKEEGIVEDWMKFEEKHKSREDTEEQQDKPKEEERDIEERRRRGDIGEIGLSKRMGLDFRNLHRKDFLYLIRYLSLFVFFVFANLSIPDNLFLRETTMQLIY